jgi:hypothetical protein
MPDRAPAGEIASPVERPDGRLALEQRRASPPAGGLEQRAARDPEKQRLHASRVVPEAQSYLNIEPC